MENEISTNTTSVEPTETTTTEKPVESFTSFTATAMNCA